MVAHKVEVFHSVDAWTCCVAVLLYILGSTWWPECQLVSKNEWV